MSAHSRHATRLRAAGAGKEKGEPDVNLIFCLLIRKGDCFIVSESETELFPQVSMEFDDALNTYHDSSFSIMNESRIDKTIDPTNHVTFPD